MPKKSHVLDVSVGGWSHCFATDDEGEWQAILKSVYAAVQKADELGAKHFAETNGEKCTGLKTLTISVKATHCNGIVVPITAKPKLPPEHVHAIRDLVIAAFEPHKHCEVVK